MQNKANQFDDQMQMASRRETQHKANIFVYFKYLQLELAPITAYSSLNMLAKNGTQYFYNLTSSDRIFLLM